MEDWRKFRAVVHRKLVEAVRRLGLRVDIRRGAAHEPEHGRYMPLGTKRSKILARRRGTCLTNLLRAKMVSECVNHPLTCSHVVHIERVTIQRDDLRFARGT